MSSNYQARDVSSLIHPYTDISNSAAVGKLVIESGRGVRLFDQSGRDYIDGLAGLWCTSLGYSNQELVEAAHNQLAKLPFAHLFTGRSHEPAIELAERLKAIAPNSMSKVFFANSGSEANDTQIKLVWYMNNALGRQKKKKIISRQKAYHGVTLASASLTGLPNNHRDFDLPLPGVVHVACPHYYREAAAGETEEEFSRRLANELEETILSEGPETVAAFIAEPVMGAGGVIIPPHGYFQQVQKVLSKYDIWLIDDEVICGFGRTGNMFGAQTFDIAPDSISVAKALTSAYLPLSAVMIAEPMQQALLAESRKIGILGHGFTYSGHPVAAAVACKTLEIYERDRIVERTARLSHLFEQRMERLSDHPLVGEARSVGLLGGLELVFDKQSKTSFAAEYHLGAKVISLIEKEGVLTRALGDTIALCPPLVISEEELGELFDKVGRALDRALDLMTLYRQERERRADQII